MGSKLSSAQKTTTTNDANPIGENTSITGNVPQSSEFTETYKLQHPGTCTGMFWRGDPRGGNTPQKGNASWPRNGSVLKGKVYDMPGMKWLEVESWKQAGSSTWVTDCKGIWMQFDQGGPVLHKVND
eukprot:CAMPEP_0182418778 /NCGR_PEP_ID=MMETSP1167-20130531/3158_1 /TAXON_ID=2988 /ORGANISM="Mallomonas Sp, Strain CCMP3275" /LENGTH=126 /DNA_ID=CAMNT_0024593165 /DNA_START=129 /DNA_END=509 /DNA_ORIENTATION=+